MTRSGLAFLAALVAVSFTAKSALAVPLYTEEFSSTPPASTVAPAAVGWNSSEAEGGGNDVGIYDTFMYYYSNLAIADATFRTELVYTTEFSGTPISLLTPDLQIRWRTRMEHQFNDDFSDGNGTGFGADLSPAIQVGGQWYVADAFYNTGNVESGTYSSPVVFSLTGATWSAIDGIDGLPGVSYGASVPTPVGSITGAGLVATFVQRQSINFDYYVISAGVPEPASLGLAGCGALALLGFRKRNVA